MCVLVYVAKRISGKYLSKITVIVSPAFRIEGGIISGVKLAGGLIPLSFCLISHIAIANCSLFSFPL